MKILSPLLLIALALAGCRATAPVPDGVNPARPTEATAPQWPAGKRFSVDPEASKLRLIVRVTGPMAGLGHPHVIGGSAIRGEIVLAEPFHESVLRLAIAVDDLKVDDPAWRRVEGLETEMDDEAIAATRRNMRSPALLDAESHPEIGIESLSISGPHWQPDIEARVTLAGETRQLTVPIALEPGADVLTATGRLVIRQSDFGLTPYSAAGGALRVSDEVLIRFRIEARSSD